MTFTVPATTLAVLRKIESARLPIIDYEVASKLSGLHQSRRSYRGLTPVFTATKTDGTPYYAPDIDEIDEEIITH